MTLRIDIDRGLALAKAMSQSTEFEHIFDGGLNTVEVLLHEVGHAISLGLDVDPSLWAARAACKKDWIDSAIAAAIDSPGVNATWEEALVLAAESILFRKLGHPIDRSTLGETAGIQGVSDYELAHALRSHEAKALAEKILDWAQTNGIVKEIR